MTRLKLVVAVDASTASTLGLRPGGFKLPGRGSRGNTAHVPIVHNGRLERLVSAREALGKWLLATRDQGHEAQRTCGMRKRNSMMTPSPIIVVAAALADADGSCPGPAHKVAAFGLVRSAYGSAALKRCAFDHADTADAAN